MTNTYEVRSVGHVTYTPYWSARNEIGPWYVQETVTDDGRTVSTRRASPDFDRQKDAERYCSKLRQALFPLKFWPVLSAEKALSGYTSMGCAPIRIVRQPDENHDEEALPMLVVRFPTGTTAEVFPDELLCKFDLALAAHDALRHYEQRFGHLFTEEDQAIFDHVMAAFSGVLPP